MTSWNYAGVDLVDYGVVTLMDDYLDRPETRGENIEIPYVHGTVDVEKFFGERHITIGIGIYKATIADIEEAFDDLHRSLNGGRQLLIQTRADASVRQAYARVENILNVNRGAGGKLAQIVIDFLLSDPLFRSNTLTDVTETIDASPTAMLVNNPGTVGERNPTIILTGPLENVVITNTENNCILTYTGIIDAADTVTIQKSASGEYTAEHSIDGNVIGNVTHSGSTALMVLIPGDNDLSVTSDDATTGTVQITFYAPYI